MPSLPVVDLREFIADPNTEAARSTAEQLRDHCHDPGFVYLTGHGIDPELERQLLELGTRFFELPIAERRSLAIEQSAAFRGYTILGDERTGGRPDHRDQLDFGPEQAAPPTDRTEPAWLRLRGPNQWPSGLPELAPVALAWLDEMHQLGLHVLRALAIALDLEPEHFHSGFVPEHDLHVKIIRYPTRPELADADPAEAQGVGLHHDTGLMTFILQSEVEGLQVRIGDEMVTAEPLPGSYVLNLGAMMQSATNGYLRATPHRVVSPVAGADRISVALFYNPTFESTFEPIDLPPALKGLARPDLRDLNGGAIHTLFGENNLKVRLRSHPDVARRHYADVVGEATEGVGPDAISAARGMSQ